MVRFLLWCLAQIFGVMVTLFTFFVWAPWLGASSHAEAVALYGAEKIPDCNAIAVNHGQFSCMSWGTTSSNPWGFAVCTAILISGIGFVAITQVTGKGLFSPQVCEAVSSRVNTIRSRFGLPDLELSRVKSLILGGLIVLVFVCVFLVSMLTSQGDK